VNGTPGPSRIARFAMAVAWSSFLSAGVLEALVFAVVDPGELRWFGAGGVVGAGRLLRQLPDLLGRRRPGQQLCAAARQPAGRRSPA
jgi:hypothetical protein